MYEAHSLITAFTQLAEQCEAPGLREVDRRARLTPEELEEELAGREELPPIALHDNTVYRQGATLLNSLVKNCIVHIREPDKATEILKDYRALINSTPTLLSLLYDADMLPAQIVTVRGAISVVAVCEAYKAGQGGS